MTHRAGYPSVFVLIALFSTVGANAAEQFRVSDGSVAALRAPVAVGGKVKLERLPVDGAEVTLELERFEVWASDADIKIFGDHDAVLETLAPPTARYFSGQIAGDPESLVVLAVNGERVDGIVWTADKRFGVGSRVRKGKAEVFIEEASVLDEIESDRFTCDFDKSPDLQQAAGRPRALSGMHVPQDNGVLATNTARWVLNLAIETDYETYLNSGSSSGNVSTFVGNLIAALSTIYRRDLRAEVRVSYLGIHTTSGDPFTVVPGNQGQWNGSTVTYSTLHGLLELGDRWHNTPPSSAKRSTTVLLSGKSAGGVAWLRVLCRDDFEYQGHWGGRYAFCGSIDPPADLSVPNPDANPGYQAPSSNYWPLRHVAHELGHNVGSPHSHCIALSSADQQTYGRTYVDFCHSGEANCYAGPTSVPSERGTIMSYCNQLGGGSVTRYTYGQNGEASYVIPPAMRTDLQNATPTMSAITAPGSLSAGASGTASVTNVAGVSYAWTVTNGTINGSATASSVNFTASAHPVTLSVTATNTVGCAVTDSATVSVGGNCTFSIAPTARTFGAGAAVATVAVTSNCAWTATSNDGWIEIIGGSSGSGNGTVTYYVYQNPTDITWVGTLVIAGQTHTVTQTAFDASEHTDFDGDGVADLFWRSQAGGQNAVWLMNGANVAVSGYVTTLDSNWTVKGIGDFDGDGRADVLWRNNASLQTVIWFMNGTVATSGVYLPPTSSEWSIHGAGDFNGDGRADILWRNSSTNDAVVWLMNGGSIQSAAWVAAPPSVWVVDGVGDFNGNGQADILWRNTSNHQSWVWLMNGAAISSTGYIATPSSVWSVKGVGDFNGDTRTDIVWRNSATSESVVWLMNGTSLLSAAYTPTASSAWNIQSVGDFDANGRADLVWRNSANGQNAMWFMNGTNVSSSTYFLTIPDTGFNIVGPK